MINAADPIDSWFLERWTKFTSSANFKLLTPAKDGSIFGEGALTYIEEKAMEATTTLWERPELEEHKNMLHGKAHEYPAYVGFVNATKNFSMRYLGTETPLFLEHEKFKGESGGSPDGINLDSANKVDAGIEIKCPKNPIYHFRRLKWKDQWDIKQNYIQCYTQIQHLLMITDAFIWFFVDYDERFKSKEKKTKIIEVKPDRKFQDNLELRIKAAIRKKYEIIEEHMNN